MSTIEYYLADPTKNMTFLCVSPVERGSFRAVTEEIMRAEPSAEQGGFISGGGADCDIRLDMSGGEFCGNAAMSAAVLWCVLNGKSKAAVRVSASGTEEPLDVRAVLTADGDYDCEILMPKAKSLREGEFGGYRFPLVNFGGIVHAICERDMEKAEAESLVRAWCAALNAEAMGLMLLDREKRVIRPLVYVAGVDTLFWENSCASGTTAAGVFLAEENGGFVDESFTEPGGVLSVRSDAGGRLILGGRVRMSAKKLLSL